jgi:hypothetical protein
MLRIASSHRLILVSALTGALGFSLAHAQTTSPQNSVVIGELQASKPDAGVTSSKAPTLAGSSVFRTFSVAGPGSSELPPIVNAPLSATIQREEVTKFVDGNRIIRTSSSRLARDGQGRTRVEINFFPPMGRGQTSLPIFVQIFDPLTGEGFSLNMQQRTANMLPSTGPSPVLQAPVAAPPVFPQIGSPLVNFAIGGYTSSSQTKETSLGEKMIDGIRAVGKRVDYSLPANSMGNEKPITIRTEQWFSPDLGVALLTTQRSSIGIDSTYKLAEIDRNEPDRSLFTVPEDFTKQLFEQAQPFNRLEGVKPWTRTN